MTTVVGLFENRDRAQRAIEALQRAGFNREDMSIVMRDQREAKALADETGVGGATAAGAVGGGLLGGLGGLLVGLGALAIPGIGPIIAAGPLVAALAGAGVGALTGGLIGALVDAGVPEEEARVYQQGVERGGILLSVNVPNNRESEARRILEQNGMRDAKYHQGLMQNPNHRYGDTDGDDAQEAATTTGGAVAGGTAGAAIGTAVAGPVGTAVGAAVGGTIGAVTGRGAAEFDDKTFRNEYQNSQYRDRYTWDQARPAYEYGWTSYRPEYQGRSWNDVRSDYERNWKGQGRFADYEPMIRTAYERRANFRGATGGNQTLNRTGEGEQVIPVVEEELQVGKRAVERGGARVNVDVEEKPVEEQVNLREERVRVERRPVDRPLTDADEAFKEGTIEMRETVEQPVVQKAARVIEEVVIGKDVNERTETVRDTVRRTDVNVENLSGETTTGARTTGQSMSTGARGFETFDQDFRNNYNTRFAKSGYSYDQFTPVYRYGYTLANDPRYSQREWSDIEPDVRRHWEERNQGTWENVKDAIRYAWDKARS